MSAISTAMSAIPDQPFVFLGGSCNPTTWRMNLAIPLLQRFCVPFYNPQVEDWSPKLIDIECRAKASAAVCLFIIDNQTRAMMSCMEAIEHISTGRRVVIAVIDIEAGSHIGDEAVGEAERKDLNRARGYLRDVAMRAGVTVHPSVKEAVFDAVAQLVWARGDAPQYAELPAVNQQAMNMCEEGTVRGPLLRRRSREEAFDDLSNSCTGEAGGVCSRAASKPKLLRRCSM